MSLAHVRRGSGEPLLLLHSLGGSKEMWAPVLDLLAAEREVIAVDMPGFGDSSMPPGEMPLSARNLAQLILDFYDTLGFAGDPHVAGISLGSWVAIECARLGRARSVAGLCSAGFWRESLAPKRGTARSVARLLLPLVPLMLRSERARRAVLSGQMRHPERLSRSEAVGLVRTYARSPGYPDASRLMRVGAVGDLSGIEDPLTLAWGEFDTLVRRTPLRALPASVTQLVLPDCGHVPTWDAPELIARVILGSSRRAA
ncbi:MAG: alpha/beta fold hydrolase [Solirubrobacterales bacterium]|nr:alpha/beta fold hydrolase [Solirubrobacterales bacterium]